MLHVFDALVIISFRQMHVFFQLKSDLVVEAGDVPKLQVDVHADMVIVSIIVDLLDVWMCAEILLFVADVL